MRSVGTLRSAIRALRSGPAGPVSRLQFASGLYAHCGWREAWSALVPGAGTRLALLGNCGSLGDEAGRENTLEFLRRAAAVWQEIYWIPGPTELAAQSPKFIYPYQVDALRELTEGFENITLLDQGEIHLSEFDVTLLGATGWTRPPADATKDPIPRSWPEHRILTAGADGVPRHLEAADAAEFHDEDIAWLEERASLWGNNRPETVVVPLTHHLCSRSLLSQELPRPATWREDFDAMPRRSTETLFQSRNLRAWLCGASGSVVSGEVGVRGGTFGAVNSCWSDESRKWRNPHYNPAQTLSLLQSSVPPSPKPQLIPQMA